MNETLYLICSAGTYMALKDAAYIVGIAISFAFLLGVALNHFWPRKKSSSDAMASVGELVMNELNSGGGCYLSNRQKIAKLSGIPAMAITMDEHIDHIANRLHDIDPDMVAILNSCMNSDTGMVVATRQDDGTLEIKEV